MTPSLPARQNYWSTALSNLVIEVTEAEIKSKYFSNELEVVKTSLPIG